MGRKTSFWIVSITLAGVFAPHCARANIVCDHSQTPASFFNARASLNGAERLDDVTEIQLMAYMTQRTPADSLINLNRGDISFYDSDTRFVGWLTVDMEGVLVPDGDHPTCTDVMTLLGNHGTCECIASPSDPPGGVLLLAQLHRRQRCCAQRCNTTIAFILIRHPHAHHCSSHLAHVGHRDGCRCGLVLRPKSPKTPRADLR